MDKYWSIVFGIVESDMIGASTNKSEEKNTFASLLIDLLLVDNNVFTGFLMQETKWHGCCFVFNLWK